MKRSSSLCKIALVTAVLSASLFVRVPQANAQYQGYQGNQGDQGDQGDQGNWNWPGPPKPHDAVPEPATLTLLGMGAVGLFAGRKRLRGGKA